LGWFFGKFNQGFSWVLRNYISTIRLLIRLRYAVIAVFVVGLVATVVVFRAVPAGFVPGEDQGSILGLVQGPDIASLQYTEGILGQVHQSLAKVPEIQSTAEIAGAGFNGNAANQGIFFAHLKPWDERTKANQKVDAILKHLNGEFASNITGALVVASNPPPIRRLSSIRTRTYAKPKRQK
jgi:HAE1 family hydrophobic/amphiphilic exporter-1